MVSNSASVRGNFTAFSPDFDLNDADNMHGLIEFDALLSLPTRSSESIGFDGSASPATTVRLQGFVRASRLRAANAYANNENNGIKTGQSDVFLGANDTLGRVEAWVAWKLVNGKKLTGYYLYYSGGAAPPSGSQSMNFASDVGAQFLHSDAPSTFGALRRELLGTMTLAAKSLHSAYGFAKPGGGKPNDGGRGDRLV